MSVPFRNDHSSLWYSPGDAAAVIPGASAFSIRKWCRQGKVPGAIMLPSGRWQIPHSGIVAILGQDPLDTDAPDTLPGIGK